MERIDILSCKNSNITLRNLQTKALLWLQDNWDTNDVFIINAPVSSGKSILATSLANWLDKNNMGKTAMITPTKILQDQYTKEFDWIPSLKGSDNYSCAISPISCGSQKRITGQYCKTDGGCGCSFIAAVADATNSNTCILNFHIYFNMIDTLIRPNLIIDEGHNTGSFLFSMFEKKLWQWEIGYQNTENADKQFVIAAIEIALGQAQEKYEISLSKKSSRGISEAEQEINSLNLTLTAVNYYGDDVLIETRKEKCYTQGVPSDIKGTEQLVIVIKPKQIAHIATDKLWPKSAVSKIVLLSGTIGEKEVKQLGLDDRRVAYFECDSPIPVPQRPIIYFPVGSMAFNSRRDTSPAIASTISKIAEQKHPNEKGIIHCTYDFSKYLKTAIGGNNRFIFHTDQNKQFEFDNFLRSKNKILVACGMSEGIDLKGDLAKWQIITQIMYPNLTDIVSKWRLKNSIDLYYWDAVKTIVQQSGRICRTPEDFGVTYVLDSQFSRLLSECKEMFPKWFLDSIVRQK